MSDMVYNIIAGVLSLGILYGIHLMSSPKTAVKGNQIGAIGMAVAIIVTLLKDGTLSMPLLWAAMLAGSAIGWFFASRVKMIQMPQLVALLNGFGGAASAFVALLVLIPTGMDADSVFSLATAGLALIVGMLTLTGSLVAAGKLHQVLAQKPVVLPNHSLLTNILLAVMGVSFVVLCASGESSRVFWTAVLFLLGGGFGVLFTVRVGGADMPVTISLLNSLSGVAGAIAGLAISDPLLVAVGGIVGASGLLLTQIMCRAMNRSLMDIMLGKTSTAGQAANKAKASGASSATPSTSSAPAATVKDPATLLAAAKKVIIIPGYGMALAQAQHKVKQLAEALEKKGATVDYAIHPVAGRMPGHMNVLLAEAGVDYDKLREMDDVNPEFTNTDLVIIIGANDVVNPAAIEAEGTPIYGMPILRADEAKHVFICNYDTKPGYAGVENPLYSKADTVTMLLGDANATVENLVSMVQQGPAAVSGAAPAAKDNTQAELANIFATAKRALIVPGYGMALAQAQHKVKQLAESLEKKGVEVGYAIHPVAGRMPGHMNVLLAEADVDYERLLEMDAANPMFADTDVVIVIGANDVVNPAATSAEGTPIYGMPILTVDQAKHVIVCNYDTKPGYAGVDNPLYTNKEKVTLLLGDANATVDTLVTLVQKGAQEAVPAASGAGQSALGSVFATAKRAMIVPGYGMALAQAQHKVKQLAETLEKNGVQVDYAIHPVAGRMPGHMNVLLAEADVDYEKLLEMDAANPMFADTDVVIIIGANDVVNPAAIHAEGTPIYGMPILRVDAAKHVVVCNYDTKPGYAGVENPLYSNTEKVTLLLGDANETVESLIALARDGASAGATSSTTSAGAATSGKADIASLLGAAKKVMIVPGYGMALAQAQHKVRQLAESFEKKGALVDYAIHPVAGRMPGHMNVLLAEADVDYEKLLEMDAANTMFANTDVVVIIGANDVVNPAAIHAEGTPIYGMPILRVDEAKHVVICNYDTKPGYAGVENPLYSNTEKVTLLLGDANETVDSLIGMLR